MGLASARALIRRHPALSVVVLEKEKDLGMYIYYQYCSLGLLGYLLILSALNQSSWILLFWVLLKVNSGTRTYICMWFIWEGRKEWGEGERVRQRRKSHMRLHCPESCWALDSTGCSEEHCNVSRIVLIHPSALVALDWGLPLVLLIAPSFS